MKPKAPKLINAAAMAAKHPNTFTRPDAKQRAAIRKGWFVKVSVEGKPMGERFWVEVLTRKGPIITGRIDNELLFTSDHGLKGNDIILFTPDNAYAVIEPRAVTAAQHRVH